MQGAGRGAGASLGAAQGLRLCGAARAGRGAGCASELRGNGERVGRQLGAYGPVCNGDCMHPTAPPLPVTCARLVPRALAAATVHAAMAGPDTRCPHIATAACHPTTQPELRPGRGHEESPEHPPAAAAQGREPAAGGWLPAAGMGCKGQAEGQVHHLARLGGFAFAAQAVRAEALAVRGRCGETASAWAASWLHMALCAAGDCMHPPAPPPSVTFTRPVTRALPAATVQSEMAGPDPLPTHSFCCLLPTTHPATARQGSPLPAQLPAPPPGVARASALIVFGRRVRRVIEDKAAMHETGQHQAARGTAPQAPRHS